MYKPLLIVIPAAIAAALAIAGTAYANPSTASATCRGGIVYEGHQYPSSGNTVTVKIDGQTVIGYPATFGDHISGSVPFTDHTVGHTWQVIWDRYNGTDGDRAQSGTVDACEWAIPTTTIDPTTTLAPTTTVGTSSTLVISDDEITPVVFAPAALVAVADPPVPQPQGVSAAFSQTLPVTGNGELWLAALAMVIVGTVAVLVARRRAT